MSEMQRYSNVKKVRHAVRVRTLTANVNLKKIIVGSCSARKRGFVKETKYLSVLKSVLTSFDQLY